MTHPSEMFEVLGIVPGTEPGEIKKAFRRVARECHPDVAGDDPAMAERFVKAREAYETLMDPDRREWAERQDRAQKAREARKGQRVRADTAGHRRMYNRNTSSRRSSQTASKQSHGGRFSARTGKVNDGTVRDGDLGLDDLFKDMGDFGFEGGRRPSTGTASRGADVAITLDVPAPVARDGGMARARWGRLKRVDHWHEGYRGPGVEPTMEVQTLEIPPETVAGDLMRFVGLGDMGEYGGPAGELIVKIRLVHRGRPPETGPTQGARHRWPPPRPESAESPPPPPRAPHMPPPEGAKPPPPAATPALEMLEVKISVAEALLGGRIEVTTAGGVVRLTVPSCTASGSRLRLRGKGADGADLLVRLRIAVPAELDERSKALIEEFAQLNPGNPRD